MDIDIYVYVCLSIYLPSSSAFIHITLCHSSDATLRKFKEAPGRRGCVRVSGEYFPGAGSYCRKPNPAVSSRKLGASMAWTSIPLGGTLPSQQRDCYLHSTLDAY